MTFLSQAVIHMSVSKS